TMRLVEGRSLLDRLEKDGPLPVERALPIFRQVAEAVQQAHDVGIIHRDLKPGNVLLSPDDTASITDFGVARSLDKDSTTRRRAGVVDRIPRAAWAILAFLFIGAGAGMAYRQRAVGPVAVPAATAAAAPTGVAVLPLVDETGDASLAWTGTGVAEMLAGHLAE